MSAAKHGEAGFCLRFLGSKSLDCRLRHCGLQVSGPRLARSKVKEDRILQHGYSTFRFPRFGKPYGKLGLEGCPTGRRQSGLETEKDDFLLAMTFDLGLEPWVTDKAIMLPGVLKNSVRCALMLYLASRIVRTDGSERDKVSTLKILILLLG